MSLYVGKGTERGQCHCLAAGGLFGTHPISSHFTPFPYATGSPLAAALVVVPRVGGFVSIPGLCRAFKHTPSRDQQCLLLLQSPLVFTAKSYEALFCWHWNPGLHGLGFRSFTPKVSLLIFIHHMWMWDPPFCWVLPCHHCHTVSSPPLFPISAPSTHLDEYGFFKSLVVGLPYSLIYWQFWVIFVWRLVVILLMVVQGGKACLPIPPSWPKVSHEESFLFG